MTKAVKLNGTGCPDFDPKVSDLVVTGHANASFANQRAGVQVVARLAGAPVRRRRAHGLRPHDAAAAGRLPRLRS